MEFDSILDFLDERIKQCLTSIGDIKIFSNNLPLFVFFRTSIKLLESYQSVLMLSKFKNKINDVCLIMRSSLELSVPLILFYKYPFVCNTVAEFNNMYKKYNYGDELVFVNYASKKGKLNSKGKLYDNYIHYGWINEIEQFKEIKDYSFKKICECLSDSKILGDAFYNEFKKMSQSTHQIQLYGEISYYAELYNSINIMMLMTEFIEREINCKLPKATEYSKEMYEMKINELSRLGDNIFGD